MRGMEKANKSLLTKLSNFNDRFNSQSGGDGKKKKGSNSLISLEIPSSIEWRSIGPFRGGRASSVAVGCVVLVANIG